MIVFLERLSIWNMLICAEQVQIQKYKKDTQNSRCPNNHAETSNYAVRKNTHKTRIPYQRKHEKPQP